jgi:hypothetical protein
MNSKIELPFYLKITTEELNIEKAKTVMEKDDYV